MNAEKLIVNPDVVLRKEFDDWAVLFNPDTAEAIGINPVGVAIWELLARHSAIEEIVTALSHDFTDIPGSSREDIETFIADLAKRGFVGSEISTSDNA